MLIVAINLLIKTILSFYGQIIIKIDQI